MAEQTNQWQRELLFFEVGAKRFSGLCFDAQDVEQVVGNLKGDAQRTAILFERFSDLLVCAGVMGTEKAAHRTKFGRFAFDDPQVRLFVEIEVASFVNL